MSSNNLLIVGLGNPGKKYEKTRHNCGADFVQLLSENLKVTLQKEDKFFSLYGIKTINQVRVHLCIPTIYVNESGKSVLSITDYLKISNEQVLVIHDDLDLPLGKIKLKEVSNNCHSFFENLLKTYLTTSSSFFGWSIPILILLKLASPFRISMMFLKPL